MLMSDVCKATSDLEMFVMWCINLITKPFLIPIRLSQKLSLLLSAWQVPRLHCTCMHINESSWSKEHGFIQWFSQTAIQITKVWWYIKPYTQNIYPMTFAKIRNLFNMAWFGCQLMIFNTRIQWGHMSMYVTKVESLMNPTV